MSSQGPTRLTAATVVTALAIVVPAAVWWYFHQRDRRELQELATVQTPAASAVLDGSEELEVSTRDGNRDLAAPAPPPSPKWVQACQAGCGRRALQKCSGCRRGHYCSQECQSKCWLEHKQLCRLFQMAARLSDVVGAVRDDLVSVWPAADRRVHPDVSRPPHPSSASCVVHCAIADGVGAGPAGPVHHRAQGRGWPAPGLQAARHRDDDRGRRHRGEHHRGQPGAGAADLLVQALRCVTCIVARPLLRPPDTHAPRVGTAHLTPHALPGGAASLMRMRACTFSVCALQFMSHANACLHFLGVRVANSWSRQGSATPRRRTC